MRPRGISDPATIPLGSSLPPGNLHAVGVHLPEWRDTVGWAARETRVVNAMRTGYPRFFVPRVVDRLAEEVVRIYDNQGNAHNGQSLELSRSAFLFPNCRYATLCLRFLHDQAPSGIDTGNVCGFVLNPDGTTTKLDLAQETQPDPDNDQNLATQSKPLSAVLYPMSLYPLAKAFWQHTGFGISSRQATFWLDAVLKRDRRNGRLMPPARRNLTDEYLLQSAKNNIRSRIAKGHSPELSRTGMGLTKQDVLLYPTGMAAITEAAAAIKSRRSLNGRQCVAAVFGFTYVDTYKTLTRVLGFDTSLYKHAEIDQLENHLNQGLKLDLLVTEFPSNPLLQTPDLQRLHDLSRQYDFVLMVDDTVGTYVNLGLMACCDVICTSLTKMFSGACNVMGGSVAISPLSPHREELLSALREVYDEDSWLPSDVRIMEYNSRDFQSRVNRANKNAELVVAQLQTHSTIEEVYYPKGSPTQALYDRFRRRWGGYGFLLSIKFTSPARAIAFHDALEVAKGPSLGTNFTLCCAYTLLAHYHELEWAAEYGVVEHLVRISVGLEDEEWLRTRLDKALRAAVEVQD
ncbi:putative cystathionine gamma-synthase [Naviculisporaceae sp. PSN 640]